MRLFCITTIVLLICPLASAQDGTPELTAEHKQLAKYVGEHSGTMTMWVSGPNADPTVMPFKEVNKSILNGFWVASEFEAGPYKGYGTSGYDEKQKKYVGTWQNNMSGNLVVMEGSYDEASHELTMTFKDYDHQTGKLADHKTVTRDKPGETRTMTMLQKKNGEWVKTFILEYGKN